MEDKPPTRQELLQMLKDMIDSYDQLPPSALVNSPTNYDLVALMILLEQLFRSENIT